MEGRCDKGEGCGDVHVDLPVGIFSDDVEVRNAAVAGQASAIIAVSALDEASTPHSFVVVDERSGNLRVVNSTDIRNTVGLRVAAAMKQHPSLLRFRSAHPFSCDRFRTDYGNSTPKYGTIPAAVPAQGGCKMGCFCPYLHVEEIEQQPILHGEMEISTLLSLHYCNDPDEAQAGPVVATADSFFQSPYLKGFTKEFPDNSDEDNDGFDLGVNQAFAARELFNGGDGVMSVPQLVQLFCALILEEQGLKNVAQVNKITPEVFDSLTASLRESVVPTMSKEGQETHYCFQQFIALPPRSRKLLLEFWMRLEEVRSIPDELSIDYCITKFGHTLSQRYAETLQAHSLASIRDLRKIQFKLFLALPLPAYILSVLQIIRERRRVKETNSPFEVISLTQRAGCSSGMHQVVSQLVKYQQSIDSSWKKSADSQVVTTAITYVSGCSCAKGGRQSFRFQPYPASSSSGGVASWCSCKREVVLSTNYELSTPSGSRCSEQNGLGKIASMGHPTSSIREVYVRGWKEGVGSYSRGVLVEDPNPLFPCGVCEGMFKKLSKDVYRKHKADISLFMFESQTEHPTKLITMPFSEISNRASRRFKSFVAEELRDV